MNPGRAIVLTDLCGSESAYVLTQRLPDLLCQVAPSLTLVRRGNAGIREASTLGQIQGQIFLLAASEVYRPGELSVYANFLSVAGQRLAPILPIIVGHEDENTTSDWLEAAFSSKVAVAPRILSPLFIASYDARIEHGGCFHLEGDTTRSLSRGLANLTKTPFQTVPHPIVALSDSKASSCGFAFR